jgi:hypothetical protein
MRGLGRLLGRGRPTAEPRSPAAAFYCVADARYFLGAVGLINSLRLVGHDEPIYLLDCGLTAEQRGLLAPEVTLVPAPADVPPYLLKTIAPLRHPAGVTILIDTDMIVTRSLSELIADAASGAVVAFENDSQRFIPEWGEILDLGPVRRQPYVCVALVLFGGEVGRRALELVDDRQSHVDFDLTYFRQNRPDYPFLYPEQDVLNAVLSSRIERERVVALDYRLSPTPPFEGLRVIDESGLRCSYDDGTEPYVIHHYAVKPWLEPTHHGVYSRLLRRCLVGAGLRIEVPESQLPRRMRTGILAFAERKRVNARERLRWHVGGPLASGARALRGRMANGDR